jgi:hypothetical protein
VYRRRGAIVLALFPRCPRKQAKFGVRDAWGSGPPTQSWAGLLVRLTCGRSRYRFRLALAQGSPGRQADPLAWPRSQVQSGVEGKVTVARSQRQFQFWKLLEGDGSSLWHVRHADVRQAIHDYAQQHLAAVQHCITTVYCVLTRRTVY